MSYPQESAELETVCPRHRRDPAANLQRAHKKVSAIERLRLE